MSKDFIRVERDGDIATVILNRPEKLNALIKPMWRQLGERLRELSADDELRCLVLRAPATDRSRPATTSRNSRMRAPAAGSPRNTVKSITPRWPRFTSAGIRWSR